MGGRGKRSLQALLSSSSLAALLVGGGAPPAYAQCATDITGAVAGCTNAATITGINIHSATVSGNIVNDGTIDPNGISLNTNSTINGSIIDNGIIAGGIRVDNTSLVNSTSNASIQVSGPTFSGGITNSGTLSSSFLNAGIRVGSVTSGGAFTVSSFSGGVTNSGQITAGSIGILVNGVSTFTGDITNSGTISAGATGISVQDVATFAGNIVNASTGTITALSGAGIEVCGCVTTFLGGITNAGTISALAGIVVSGVTQLGSTSGGGITNSGTIAASVTGIAVTAVPTFNGGILNSGTIIAPGGLGINVAVGSTFLGGISNSGTISGFGGIAVSSIVQFGNGSAGAGIANSGLITASVGTGISVVNVATFAGGIVNTGNGSTSGVISAGNVGISVSSVAVFGVSSAGGGIVNTGAIISAGTGISVVNVATFLGGITNAGGATILAGNTGIFVRSTTFSGGISNAGTISASNIGIDVVDVSAFSGGIVNAGTGTINGAQTGIAIGPGVTFAAGSHIVNSGIISGGVSAIDASPATSAVTIDQNAGTITGAIRLSANADVLNVNGGTINGDIVGQGSSDTLNFGLGAGGSFTYGSAYKLTGINQVNVNSGAVILNGTGNSASNVLVASGAGLQVGDASHTGASLASTNPIDVFGTLSGHGSVLGGVFVENGGSLLPGGSIGQLTINGNLALSSGSFYVVEISPTNASKTLINGSATLGGATVKVIPQLGIYGAQTYTILTATNPLGPGNIFNPTPIFTAGSAISPALTYDAFNAYLSFAALVFTLNTPANANQNEQNVINGINTVILNGGSLPPGFQTLAGLSGNALLGAIDQLSGQGGGSFAQGGFMAGSLFLNLMLNPFNEGRGDTSFGPAVGYAPEQAHPMARAAADAFASVNKAPVKANFDQRFGFWGGSYGGNATISGDAITGAVKTTARAYGFATGTDYRLTADTTVGFALAGGGTNWGLAQGLGGGRSDMFQAGLYASTHWGAAYLSGALAYSWHDVTTDRTVTVAGTDKLTGRFRANTLSARLEAGYRYRLGGFGVTPYAAAQGQWMHLPSFDESATSGSNQFALSYNAQNPTATRSELGSWFDYTYLLKQGASLKLYSRAAWAHDFNPSATASAVFQTLPGSSFLINTAKPSGDRALVTAGAEYKMGSGWSILGKFDGEFSNTTSIYSGTGVLRKQW